MQLTSRVRQGGAAPSHRRDGKEGGSSRPGMAQGTAQPVPHPPGHRNFNSARSIRVDAAQPPTVAAEPEILIEQPEASKKSISLFNSISLAKQSFSVKNNED